MNDDTSKTMIKFLVVAGGAYALYWYLQSSGLWAQWFGGAVASVQPGVAPVTTLPTNIVSTQASQPVSTSGSSAAVPASYLQAASTMTMSAGSTAQNFDDWSYYWQNNPAYAGAPAGYGSSGSISPTMIDAMIAAGGGNRAALITAQQWVALLWQQQQAGVSGLGMFARVRAPQYGWLN